MSNMSEDDMQKWAGRAQKVAKVAQAPLALYKRCSGYAAMLGAGGAMALITAGIAVMFMGHLSGTF